MSCHAGPDIVENGLVFCYDMNNTQKSWRGKPTTNLHSNPDLSLGLTSNYGQYGPTPPIISTANDVPTTLGQTRNVLQCQCDPGGWGAALWFAAGPQTVGTTYTISYYIRCLTSASIGLGFSCQNGSGDQNSLSHSIAVTNKWQRFSHTATVDIAKGSWFVYGGTNGSVFQIADFQFEESSFATPIVSGTRSNTQAILDLTGNNTITASNLTYDSNGIFRFNGSTSCISIINPTPSNLPYSITQWIKPDNALTDTTETTGAGRKTPLVGPGPQWSPGYWLTARTFRVHSFTEYRDHSINLVGDLNWHFIGQIFDGTNCYGILDGFILSGGTRTAYSPGFQSSILIGAENTTGNSYNWNGKLSQLHLYNRALSAAEVAQNFNATRRLYGI